MLSNDSSSLNLTSHIDASHHNDTASSVATSQQQFASWIWIGAASAVLGNLFYSIGLFLQRYVHKNNVLKLPYTQLPMWWLGLLGIGLGQLGNFVAYGMAPASLVAPLGGITGIYYPAPIQ